MLTQLIYRKTGKENVFNQFEEIAIPIIAKHGGNLLLRVRPNKESMIAGSLELPYEIHLVSFANEESFISYGRDEERQRFLYLKEESIRSTLLINGKEIS